MGSASSPEAAAAPGAAAARPAAEVGEVGAARLRERIRPVPDYPQPGVLFRDITPLLRDAAAFAAAVEAMAAPFDREDLALVASIESRGFLFAAPLALRLRAGLALLRKPDKLPAPTLAEDYRLEYGAGRLEMHVDAVEPDARVLVVDDVLATGGSAAAATALVSRRGGVVAGYSFLLELEGLGGRRRLETGAATDRPATTIHSVLRFP